MVELQCRISKIGNPFKMLIEVDILTREDGTKDEFRMATAIQNHIMHIFKMAVSKTPGIKFDANITGTKMPKPKKLEGK
jgi:hypothetical protein